VRCIGCLGQGEERCPVTLPIRASHHDTPVEVQELAEDGRRPNIENNRVILAGRIPGSILISLYPFFVKTIVAVTFQSALAKNAAQLHDDSKIRRNPFDSVLSRKGHDHTCQITYVVFEARGFQFNIPLEDGWVYFPSPHQLVDVLRREKVAVCSPISLELQNRTIHLGLERNFDLQVVTNQNQTGQPEPLLVFPLGELGMFRGFGRSSKDFDLALSHVPLPPQEALMWIPASIAAWRRFSFWSTVIELSLG